MVGDTLGRGRVYVSDNVEGGFQVMLVGAAAVGGQEGHCGSEVRPGVRGYPGRCMDPAIFSRVSFTISH